MDRTSPTEVQLERVLHIMLQGGHLTPEERLACFRSSKGMAELVLRHAPCTHLSLTLPTGGSSGSAGSSSSAGARAEAAQQLAAQSDNVTLALRRPAAQPAHSLLTPAACLWQRITTIQLHGMPLGQTSGSQLQLHKLPRLHTLRLQTCRTAQINTGSNSQQHRSTSVRTLECFTNYIYDDIPPAAFYLADFRQLQTVISNSRDAIGTLLPQLPALQELHMHCRLEDIQFRQLLAHPRLARVRLQAVELRHSYAGTPCNWESLHLEEGASLTTLGRMPLAGIRSCIVQRHLNADCPLEVLAAGASSRLVFQDGPGHHAWRNWLPAEPTFQVWCDALTGPEIAPVITLIMRQLAPGTALDFRGMSSGRNELDVGAPEVLASLAAAPPTLTIVCFCICHSPVMVGRAMPGAGVITHMAHVRHVIIARRTAAHTVWLEQLRVFVTGVTRPLRLTLAITRQWQTPVMEEIRRWVATHASEHVHVELQQCQ